MSDGFQVYQKPAAASLADIENATLIVPLTSAATPYTLHSFKVKQYGSREVVVQFTNTDGRRMERRITVDHNATTGADATAASWSIRGRGYQANLAIDVVLSGTGANQLATVRATPAETGWTAAVYVTPYKAP